MIEYTGDNGMHAYVCNYMTMLAWRATSVQNQGRAVMASCVYMASNEHDQFNYAQAMNYLITKTIITSPCSSPVLQLVLMM